MTAAAPSLRPVRPTELLGRPERRPALRAGVPRPRLVAALDGPGRAAARRVVAPAGFGKTTLLREWSAARPAAVRLDHAERRARRLRGRCCAPSPRAVDAATARRRGRPHRARARRRPRAAAPTRTRHWRASSPSCPPTSSVALASRAELPLPLARLRAEGPRHRGPPGRAGDDARRGRGAAARRRPAARTRRRRRAVAQPPRAGPRRSRSPRGRCATSRFRARPRRASAAATGSSRTTCATRSSPALSVDERRFVRRTAILDVLTAPACDRVLGRPGSAAMLAGLARAASRWWRSTARASATAITACCGDLLRAELRRAEPELEAELHRRASAWHAQRGRPRPRPPARAGRGRARARRRSGLGRCAAARSSRARAPPSSTGSASSPRARSPRTRAWPWPPRHELVHGHGDLAEHWLTAAAAAGRSPRSRAASPRCARRSAATASSAWPRTPRTASRAARPGEPLPGAVRAARAASPTICSATPSRRAAGSRRRRAAPP